MTFFDTNMYNYKIVNNLATLKNVNNSLVTLEKKELKEYSYVFSEYCCVNCEYSNVWTHSFEEAYKYFVARMNIGKNAQDVHFSFVRLFEHDNYLCATWGDHSVVSEYDRIFRPEDYTPDKPRNFEQLEKYLREGKSITIGWADRAPLRVEILTKKAYLQEMKELRRQIVSESREDDIDCYKERCLNCNKELVKDVPGLILKNYNFYRKSMEEKPCTETPLVICFDCWQRGDVCEDCCFPLSDKPIMKMRGFVPYKHSCNYIETEDDI